MDYYNVQSGSNIKVETKLNGFYMYVKGSAPHKNAQDLEV